MFAVGTHLKLSIPDIQGASEGFGAIIGLLFSFNLFTLWIGDFATYYAGLVGGSYSFFYTIMLFTMVLSLFFMAIFALFILIKLLFQSQ